MQVRLNEAARLTTRDVSTITRACQAGRPSFCKNENGSRVFELEHRLSRDEDLRRIATALDRVVQQVRGDG
jgi:hypothetical protein